MQTFLPYSSFGLSAASLDLKRLGKQRVENLQIMTTLLTGRKAWEHHPAVLMWRGYEECLLAYQYAMCQRWITNVTLKGKAYSDTCYEKTLSLFRELGEDRTYEEPPWLGREDVHISHQSKLISKDFHFYSPQFPEAPEGLEYVWPIQE
jgi:hypothetical protein